MLGEIIENFFSLVVYDPPRKKSKGRRFGWLPYSPQKGHLYRRRHRSREKVAFIHEVKGTGKQDAATQTERPRKNAGVQIDGCCCQCHLQHSPSAPSAKASKKRGSDSEKPKVDKSDGNDNDSGKKPKETKDVDKVDSTKERGEEHNDSKKGKKPKGGKDKSQGDHSRKNSETRKSRSEPAEAKLINAPSSLTSPRMPQFGSDDQSSVVSIDSYVDPDLAGEMMMTPSYHGRSAVPTLNAATTEAEHERDVERIKEAVRISQQNMKVRMTKAEERAAVTAIAKIAAAKKVDEAYLVEWLAEKEKENRESADKWIQRRNAEREKILRPPFYESTLRNQGLPNSASRSSPNKSSLRHRSGSPSQDHRTTERRQKHVSFASPPPSSEDDGNRSSVPVYRQGSSAAAPLYRVKEPTKANESSRYTPIMPGVKTYTEDGREIVMLADSGRKRKASDTSKCSQTSSLRQVGTGVYRSQSGGNAAGARKEQRYAPQTNRNNVQSNLNWDDSRDWSGQSSGDNQMNCNSAQSNSNNLDWGNGNGWLGQSSGGYQTSTPSQNGKNNSNWRTNNAYGSSKGNYKAPSVQNELDPHAGVEW